MAATLTEVARRAGVSTATASRALSGRRAVADELVDRVKAAARDLDYRPNALASSLRRQQTETIGLVVPQISNAFFPDIIESVERALQTQGVDLLLCDSQSDVDIERRRVRALLSRRVDGLLISPVGYQASAEILSEAAASVRVVQIDQYVSGHAASWVGVDDRAGIDQIVAHLVAQGARTASLISCRPDNSSAVLRLAAYRSACRAAGLRQRGRPQLGSFSREWGLAAADRLVSAGAPPDAIVCGSDEIALGVLATLHRRGVRVPGDVLVTGYDGIAMSELCDPALTTARQPVEQIAGEAVRLLGSDRAARVALRPDLVVRASTGATEMVS